MKKSEKQILFLVILAVLSIAGGWKAFCQQQNEENQSVFMDFRNQKTADIIYSLARLCGKSVIVDETVTGNSTFHFEDRDFESALNRFGESRSLFVSRKDDVFYVSKVFINVNEKNGKIDVDTEETSAACFLRYLSKKTETTIMFDPLPEVSVTIRLKNAGLEDVLNLVLMKLAGFGLERIGAGYFVSKNSSSSQAKRNLDVFNLSESDGKFSLNLEKAGFVSVLDVLFKKSGKEYSLLVKNAGNLENLYFKEKNFDELLELILQQAGCTFAVRDGIWYVFEASKKDFLKSFKQVKLLKLKNISAELFLKLLPGEIAGTAVIKADEARNLVVLAGTESETEDVEKFLEKVDVEEFLSLENETVRSVRLKFIKCEELLSSLPASLNKSKVTKTFDNSLVFFSGTDEEFAKFNQELKELDKPKQQIKYQLLVVQRQKTEGSKLNSTFTAEDSDKNSSVTRSLTLSNIFNINFDIISKLGLQFAFNFNAELSSGKSRVLADTTLNGISGESISFSNTNTYRYRDIVVDTSGDLYTSTTREISSGLTLSINGWVSGDDMITAKIDAQVSKQGSTTSSGDTSNPPSTSEKKVSTSVRARSGESVIIGGLFQQETDITEKRIPVLGNIPVVGKLFRHKTSSLADTEFVIYLVPFVEKKKITSKENLKRFKEKYGETVNEKV